MVRAECRGLRNRVCRGLEEREKMVHKRPMVRWPDPSLSGCLQGGLMGVGGCDCCPTLRVSGHAHMFWIEGCLELLPYRSEPYPVCLSACMCVRASVWLSSPPMARARMATRRSSSSHSSIFHDSHPSGLTLPAHRTHVAEACPHEGRGRLAAALTAKAHQRVFLCRPPSGGCRLAIAPLALR